MFLRMRESLARNPATAMSDILRAEEDDAVAELPLSFEEEREIGQVMLDEYLAAARRKGLSIERDTDRVRYLEALVERFAARMRLRDRYRSLRVFVLDAKEPDARAFPGGAIVFSTAILEEPDEATVAGIVAHEVAHLDRGHLIEQAKRAKLARRGFGFPAGAGPASLDAMMRQGLVMGAQMSAPHRPEHEIDADCTAASWLFIERYDPRPYAAFLERLRRHWPDQPNMPFLRGFQTHPPAAERRDEVLARYRQLARWKPRQTLVRGEENLQRLEPLGGAEGG
jgi:predicted Zn-dependent protease